MCPHCLQKNAALFESTGFQQPVSKNSVFVFTCRTCGKSLIMELRLNSLGATLFTDDCSVVTVNTEANVLRNYHNQIVGSLIDHYPKPITPLVPEHLSETVHKNFLEAKELFLLKRYNPSGMTSRRTIDLATKELLPDHKGQLKGRIKDLLKSNIITQQLFDWANIIRLSGNDANHEYEDFTEYEAQQLLDFAEMFLLYAFTYREKVQIKSEALSYSPTKVTS